MKLKKEIRVDGRKFNHNKKIIAIQGLGFVGSVMALICANADKDNLVFGIDLPIKQSKSKIKDLNNCKFPFKSEDKNISIFHKKSIIQNNFYCTTSLEPYKYADIIIININLDVKKKSNKINKLISYDVDLKNFKKAIKTIGENCKSNALIILESTVPPGTTEKIVKPIIMENLLKRNLTTNKIKIAHSYERVMPGKDYINSIKNFYRVFSGIDKKSAIAVKTFLKTIINTKKYPLTELNKTTESEIAKVLENSFRATNIAFMVEWTRLAEKMGSNIYNIVNTIRKRPTHKNIMYPGIGVGGYCLTKDSLLAEWSLNNIFKINQKLDFSFNAIKTNDLMPYFSSKFFKSVIKKFKNKKKNILLLGCAYAPGIGDTRNSPVEIFYNQIKNKYFKINVSDPYVDFWDEKKIKTKQLSNKLLKETDFLVISTGHNEYKNNNKLIKQIIKFKVKVIDLIGIFRENQVNQLKKFNLIKVLGRGDL